MNISTKLKGLVAACVAAVGMTAFAETEGVQLWEGGPIWATSNLGESEVAEHPEYGALYNFESAAAEVAKLGNRWHLPTKDDFDKLVDTSVCTREWDDMRKGWTFTGTGLYSSKSIFFPAAGFGFDSPDERGEVGVGTYWTSTVIVNKDGEFVAALYFEGNDRLSVNDGMGKDFYFSVRAVKDFVPLSVTIDKVETVAPWDSQKGAITVEYTLGGLADVAWPWFKVAFKVTAKGQTASVTNAVAQLTDGKQAVKTINTVELFGKEVVARDAKVKVELIAVPPPPAGQLWEGGPIWASDNLGKSEVAEHPEYGGLYNIYKADAAIKDELGEEWRLPTKEEFKQLVDTSVCDWQWNGTTKSFTVTGKGFYASNSITLSQAGFLNPQYHQSRATAGVQGFYWSSSVENDYRVRLNLCGSLDEDSFNVRTEIDSIDCSVRPVRDAK